MKLISLIIPVHNEEAVLPLLQEQLLLTAGELSQYQFEFLLIDDGSQDKSYQLLQSFAAQDSRFCVLRLSRNFGKEAALLAGIDTCRGDAAVFLDADLQDPPQLIPRMLECWEAGYQDVYARRISRQGESIFKRASAWLYYRILARLSEVSIQPDTGDFRLLDRRCILALRSLREQNRCTKSLFSWIGFRKKELLFHRQARAAGKSQWKLGSLLNLAVRGITSLTTAPLRWIMILALVLCLSCIPLLAAGILLCGPAKLLLLGLGCVCFLLGLQTFALGILGEYIGQIFTETKGRPVYLVDTNEAREGCRHGQY